MSGDTSKRRRNTGQYTINLRKNEVESQEFKCDEEVIIAPKPEFQELIETSEKYIEVMEQNRGLEEKLSQLQIDYNKLENEYKQGSYYSCMVGVEGIVGGRD